MSIARGMNFRSILAIPMRRFYKLYKAGHKPLDQLARELKRSAYAAARNAALDAMGPDRFFPDDDRVLRTELDSLVVGELLGDFHGPQKWENSKYGL